MGDGKGDELGRELYHRWLNKSDRYSLEYRRMRGYLIVTFTILRENDRIDVKMFPAMGESQMRVIATRLRGDHFKLKCIDLFYKGW